MKKIARSTRSVVRPIRSELATAISSVFASQVNSGQPLPISTTIDMNSASLPAILTTLGATFTRAQSRYRWNSSGTLDNLSSNVIPMGWNPTDQRYGFEPSTQVSTRWINCGDPGNASWVKTGTSVPGATTTSPDTSLTAKFVAETATTATHEVSRTQAVSNAQSCYLHAVIKTVGRDFVALQFKSTNSAFALSTVVFGGMLSDPYVFSNTSGLTVEVNKRGSGWVELGIATTTTATATGTMAIVGCDDSGVPSTTTAYLGDTSKGFYWFLFQNIITSYMPPPVITAGSNITILADDLTFPTSALSGFGACESFQVVARRRPTLVAASRTLISTGNLAANSANNRSTLLYTSSNTYFATMTSAGVSNSASITVGSGVEKIAGSFALNCVRIASTDRTINRAAGAFARPVGVDTVYIGQSSTKGTRWNGWIYSLTIFHNVAFNAKQLARYNNG